MKNQKFYVSTSVSNWLPNVSVETKIQYEVLNMIISNTLTIRGNSSDCVSIFKNSGSFAWDSQAYSLTPFVAPVTLEFNKLAGFNSDNGHSYAMIGWNVDPTTDANYTSLDYCSYPYQQNFYSVYNAGSQVSSGQTWNSSLKFYIVYDTAGNIKHYNGSNLLYNVVYGTGKTVYLDSSFYSVASTFGGFTNIRVTKNAWNGTSY